MIADDGAVVLARVRWVVIARTIARADAHIASVRVAGRKTSARALKHMTTVRATSEGAVARVVAHIVTIEVASAIAGVAGIFTNLTAVAYTGRDTNTRAVAYVPAV